MGSSGGDFWQLTCEILQNPADPIVEKPKLQEKYLVKPPFRYCHDIITAVQKKTGFAPGLYEGAELDSRAIQDKEAKVAYLQKMVDVVSLVLGQPVPVKPSKIVAGLEPENTNLFFQMLGRACKMDNGAKAVEQVLGRSAAGGEPSPAAPPPARPASRPSSQQPDAVPPAAAPPAQDGAPEEPRKEKKREHRSSSREPSSKDKERPPSSSKHRSSKAAPPPAPAHEPSPPPPSQPVVEVAPPAPSQPPARPSSARKGPPKPSKEQPPPPPAAAVPPATPSAGGSRAGSAASGQHPRPPVHAEPAAARPIAVMAEGAKDNSDDEVEVVHEQMPARRQRGPSGEQGVLVKDIREAEEDLKKAGAEAQQAAGAEVEQGQGIILKRMGNKAGGHAGIKDFNVIREMVQKLCQASHPLAKSMDYLQEDLENMGKEYRFWKTERHVFAGKLADEERLAGDTKGDANIGADLDNQIKQVRERTLGLKAQVLRNDETVAKLLQMAVTGTGR